MSNIKRFTQGQIERANDINVVDYVKSRGMEVTHSGQWYKAKGQGGLYFKAGVNTWHWEVESAGGKGCISLCMKLENKTWKEAVQTLLDMGENEQIQILKSEQAEPEEKKEFALPKKNDTYKHVFAYLIKQRGIDPALVKRMVKEGYLYENDKRSCVFVGYDMEGVPRHAMIRSTNTEGDPFKGDVPGSIKEYSFSLSGETDTLCVCESPIDVLSYMTWQGIKGLEAKDSYLSLSGLSDRALSEYLKNHSNIRWIRLCLDKDRYGEEAAERMTEKFSINPGEGKGKYYVRRERPMYKDWNEDLCRYRKCEKTVDYIIEHQPMIVDGMIMEN